MYIYMYYFTFIFCTVKLLNLQAQSYDMNFKVARQSLGGG